MLLENSYLNNLVMEMLDMLLERRKNFRYRYKAIRHKMGKQLSKEEQEQKEVNELRTKVIKLFQGQQLLFVGTIGSGKSSLVNSVNHTLNLVDPKVPYQEFANIGGATAGYGTMTYRAYTMKRTLSVAQKSSTKSFKCSKTFRHRWS